MYLSMSCLEYISSLMPRVTSYIYIFNLTLQLSQKILTHQAFAHLSDFKITTYNRNTIQNKGTSSNMNVTTWVLCDDERHSVSSRLHSNETTLPVHGLFGLCMEGVKPVKQNKNEKLIKRLLTGCTFPKVRCKQRVERINQRGPQNKMFQLSVTFLNSPRVTYVKLMTGCPTWLKFSVSM